MSPRRGASGAPLRIETYAPRSGAGTLALREPRRHVVRRSAVLGQARRTLDELEAQFAEEELARAEERARLDEGWALLRGSVESCRR